MSRISKVTEDDLPALEKLVNSAYRGEEAKKGWTHEADLIEGNLRTDINSLRQLLQDPASTFLKYTEGEDLLGCVYLQVKGTQLYLGMLSVHPSQQGKGIGKNLLQASEEFAKERGSEAIEMTVISVRKELIDWYTKWGYRSTGRTMPFHDDGRFGIPRQPIEFLVLEKRLKY